MVQEKQKERTRARKEKERGVTERAKRAKPVTGKALPKAKATAADKAKFAPGRGGLGALSKKVKAAKAAKKKASAKKKKKY